MDAVRKFAQNSKTDPKVIVEIQIDINRIIDLTDELTRCMNVQNVTGRNYASHFEEVLIEGYIPPENISIALLIS